MSCFKWFSNAEHSGYPVMSRGMKVLHELRYLLMKTVASLSVSWLIRWEYHLGHAKVVWHKIWICERFLQNSCLISWPTSKSKPCQKTCSSYHWLSQSETGFDAHVLFFEMCCFFIWHKLQRAQHITSLHRVLFMSDTIYKFGMNSRWLTSFYSNST